MSKTHGHEFRYHCVNDCDQCGCPGHSIVAISHNSSDTIEIRIDGRKWLWTDNNEWKAAIKAVESIGDE